MLNISVQDTEKGSTWSGVATGFIYSDQLSNKQIAFMKQMEVVKVMGEGANLSNKHLWPNYANE